MMNNDFIDTYFKIFLTLLCVLERNTGHLSQERERAPAKRDSCRDEFLDRSPSSCDRPSSEAAAEAKGGCGCWP